MKWKMKNSKENIKRNQRKQINSLEGKVCFFDTQGIPSKINLKMKKVNQMFMYL